MSSALIARALSDHTWAGEVKESGNSNGVYGEIIEEKQGNKPEQLCGDGDGR